MKKMGVRRLSVLQSCLVLSLPSSLLGHSIRPFTLPVRRVRLSTEDVFQETPLSPFNPNRRKF